MESDVSVYFYICTAVTALIMSKSLHKIKFQTFFELLHVVSSAGRLLPKNKGQRFWSYPFPLCWVHHPICWYPLPSAGEDHRRPLLRFDSATTILHSRFHVIEEDRTSKATEENSFTQMLVLGIQLNYIDLNCECICL